MNSGNNVREDMRGVLPAGTSLRGYELKSILGQGAFGITYRARDTTLGRDVAVKEYLPATLAIREGRTTVMPRSADHAEQFAWGRERFLDEARTLARLDQTPGIVRVHDFLEANGTAYMVMALIEGETLNKRLLREQRLAPEAVARLVFPLLDGLEEVHGIGFLHRDIKPANVMVDARGRPTLIDFGAARAAMAEQSSTLTAIFTPGYAAPEQLSSAKLGPWTDIYGLAATLYHAITGRIPPSAMDRVLSDTCEKLSELRPEGFSPALLAGIDAGLAVRVVDRPQSIAEWRHALRTGEARLSGQEETQIARRPLRPSRLLAGRAKPVAIGRPTLWSAAAAAVLLLAGGGWLVFQASQPASVSGAALTLSVEQLEQALAERRKADNLAAEKRQLEEAARKKAAAEAEANRQAAAELEQARQARAKVEEELTKLKADIEARRQDEAGQRKQAEASAQRAAEEEAKGKVEAEVAALRQAEEEARKKAVADAEAKRQADEALAKAEAERQRAEQEARDKAEAQAMALKRASEETQRKAVEAEARRQAEEAQAKERAERDKAEADAKARAEADKAAAVLAKQKEEAETAEKGLRLDAADRERLQVALTTLGFDTRGSDGLFGPRTRDMIAAWQKARNQPATGFLTSAQQQAILNEAASALSKHDAQKRTEEEPKARTAPPSSTLQAPNSASLPAPTSSAAIAPTASAPSTATRSGITSYDGAYSGAGNTFGSTGSQSRSFMSLQVDNGHGSGTIDSPGCETSRFSMTVSPSGSVSGEGYLNCVLGTGTATMPAGPIKVHGAYKGGALELTVSSSLKSFTAILKPGGPKTSPAPSPDGLWRGTYSCMAAAASLQAFSLDIEIRLANGVGTWRNPSVSGLTGNTFDIQVSVDQDVVTVTRAFVGPFGPGTTQARATLRGRYSAGTISAGDREQGSSSRACNLTLARV